MEILNTTSYDQFKTFVSNREVDENHVIRLMRMITKKNLLPSNPIKVTSKMEVVDGQHRLEAASRLGLPIYYICDDNLAEADIATLNTNQKNWSVMDYVNYWTVKKKPGFDKLSAFLSENPKISVSTALMLMDGFGSRNTKELREGVIDVFNYDRACEVARILKFFRNIIDFAYERNFVLAVSVMVNTTGYDHAIMESKLEFQSRSLVRCISSRQYVELLEEIYNYRSSKNKLKFT